MSEERRQVLQMLADGQVTTEEADRLISVLDGSGPAAPSPAVQDSGVRSRPRYLRVIVEDNDSGEGPTRVNVRVPFQLLRAGVRLASLIPEVARDPINQALSKQRIRYDVAQIKPADLEDLVEQLGELRVDVDQSEGKVKVRVFAE